MRRYVLSVLAYVAATFVTQAASHFAINADHYAAVTYLRKDPIFPLGVLSMLIQGSVFSYLYARTAGSKRSIPGAIGFAWMGGSILVTYIALAEAAKYGSSPKSVISVRLAAAAEHSSDRWLQ